MEYNFKKIEAKWQKEWEKNGLYKAKEDPKKEKFYCLIEFPYPSGEGLHVGHPRSYTAMDIIARKRRMQGYNVLYPIGWDAFGLPTENYAIKTGIQPAIATEKNIKNSTRQLKALGFSFDWSREINTTDQKYYKWTQWMFLQFFKHGLAYKDKIAINWCSKCKIGLANEEVVAGKCERCGGTVEKRIKEQWMLKITKYAERLIDDLKKIDYAPQIKEQQIHWIGRSDGAEVDFAIKKLDLKIKVFTTRPDTLFGATYMVLAPEHEVISNLKSQILNFNEVAKYIKKAKEKSDLERQESKEKTGVELKGIKAINPVSNEEISIWVADYVLTGYGTGAIMAVPAHDERDFEFAKKFNLPIIQTIALNLEEYNRTIKTLELLQKIQKAAEKAGVEVWVLGGLACAFYAKVIYRRHEDLDLIAKTEKDFYKLAEIFEKLGFKKIREKKLDDELSNIIFQADEGIEIDIGLNKYKFGLKDLDFEAGEKEIAGYKALVLSKRFVKSFKEMQVKERNKEKDKLDMEFLDGRVIVEDGYAVNSGKFNGLKTEQFKKEITKWLEEKKIGKKAVNYKLRDWVFSRQRYWGEPIPLVYCEKCGWVPVSEKDLPVELPKVKKYEPTDTSESPLAAMEKWVETKCPKCSGPARRETDTMPNWAGSSWYFLRYTDPQNKKEFASEKNLKYWMPIDWYNGGMEHVTLHLLYSRFWYKFLYDIGVIPKECGDEPYKKRTSHGLILGEGGEKMSKSRGNVINPDDVVGKFGADTMRIYEMFMGPFDQAIPWDEKGVVGVYRFLERTWRLQEKLKIQNAKLKITIKNEKLERLVHQTIKKVGEDIEQMKFNTAVSALMILANEMSRKDFTAVQFKIFLKLLSPFAPHLAEELWEKLGSKKSIHLEKWPEYNPGLVVEEEIDLVIQINGKMRDSVKVKADIGEEEAKKVAIESEKVKKWIEGKEVRKIIFVKGRLVNIVV